MTSLSNLVPMVLYVPQRKKKEPGNKVVDYPVLQFVLQLYGHPRVLGIRIPKTLVIRL